VLRWGFVLLYDVPTEPGMVLEVVAGFEFVRETNYGALFDVRVQPAPGIEAIAEQGPRGYAAGVLPLRGAAQGLGEVLTARGVRDRALTATELCTLNATALPR
jgi:hypothetical protein